MISCKWKVEQEGSDAIITTSTKGRESVTRETGDKAAALLNALQTVGKLGVWFGPSA